MGAGAGAARALLPLWLLGVCLVGAAGAVTPVSRRVTGPRIPPLPPLLLRARPGAAAAVCAREQRCARAADALLDAARALLAPQSAARHLSAEGAAPVTSVRWLAPSSRGPALCGGGRLVHVAPDGCLPPAAFSLPGAYFGAQAPNVSASAACVGGSTTAHRRPGSVPSRHAACAVALTCDPLRRAVRLAGGAGAVARWLLAALHTGAGHVRPQVSALAAAAGGTVAVVGSLERPGAVAEAWAAARAQCALPQPEREMQTFPSFEEAPPMEQAVGPSDSLRDDTERAVCLAFAFDYAALGYTLPPACLADREAYEAAGFALEAVHERLPPTISAAGVEHDTSGGEGGSVRGIRLSRTVQPPVAGDKGEAGTAAPLQPAHTVQPANCSKRYLLEDSL